MKALVVRGKTFIRTLCHLKPKPKPKSPHVWGARVVLLILATAAVSPATNALEFPGSWRYSDQHRYSPGLFFEDGVSACVHSAGNLYDQPCGQNGITYSNARWFTADPTYGTGCKYTVTYWGTCPNTLQVVEPSYYQNWVLRDRACPWPLSLNGAGQCAGPDDVTPPVCCPMTNHPVQISKGWKFWSETDFVKPFEFKRYYTSRPSNGFMRSGLGQQWRHTFDRSVRVTEDPTKVWLVRPEGAYMPFSQDGGGQWTPAFPSALKLSSSGSGYSVINEQDERETYNTSGVLVSIQTRDGRVYSLQYDAVGLLTSVTDDQGRALVFTATTDGYSLASVTDPNGLQLQFQYTAYATGKQLTAVRWTESSGVVRQRTYHFEKASNPTLLTGITDESGQRYSTYTYDALNRVQSTALWKSATEQVNVTTFGYPTSTTTTVTSPLGGTSTYTSALIAGAQRMTGNTQPCSSCGNGSAQAITYDSAGYPQSVTDFNGNITKHTYDTTRGLETQRIDAFGTGRLRTDNTSWHSSYRLPEQRDTLNAAGSLVAIKKWSYNSRGQTLALCQVDPETSVAQAYVCGSSASAPTGVKQWTFTYCEQGDVTAETCPLLGLLLSSDGPRTDVSDVTTYLYYASTDLSGCATSSGPCRRIGDLWKVTNAAGHVLTISNYEPNGRPRNITDANGVVTTLTYDLRQRLTSRTVGTEQTIFEYWPTGLLKKATLPDGSYLEYAYDAAHRLTDINDAEGNHIHYTLDAMGNRTNEEAFDSSQALARTRTQVFNTLNQLWKQIGAAGGANVTTTFGYDNNGNQTSINAPLSRNTSQTYDELNRLNTVTDPESGLTTYGYDALDQLISVTDPKGLTTSYTYNGLGDLKQQVSPDTGATIYTYDSGGNLKTSTDARSKTATYDYDALNRVTSVTYADQVIGYTYDTGTNQKGRLTQLTDNSGSTSWSYDTHGRVLSRQQTMGAIGKSIGYSYDTYGRLETLTLPSGNVITYGYANGKVVSLTLNGSTTLLSNVLYQPFGPTTGWTWGNSTLAVRDYDQDGKITLADSAGLKTYAYDDAFRITGITDATDPSLSQTYGYDLLDRLTSATGTSLNQSWTYDDNGNRLTQGGSQASTYTVSSTSNRINSIAGALTRTYGYDNAGNTTSDGSATYTYNDAGRMISVTKSGVTSTYELNGLGQRVRKTTSSVTTYFVYDEAGHLIGEYDNAGSLIAETVWFGDIPVVVLKPSGSGGVNVFHIHTDHLNTPRRITRPSDDAIVWRWDSDPFGTTLANENPSGLGAFTYNSRFPGQYYDSEIGLHYNYFRDYDPSTGRYVQSDPIGLQGGLNTFAYAFSNPLLFSDPFGLDAAECRAALRQTGMLVGGATGFACGCLLGGVAGGTGGTLVGPGGTIAGAAGGCGSAGPVGGVAGALLGGIAGDTLASAVCEDEPDCSKATPWQLVQAGITDAHEFKSDHGAQPNSRFDICACKDGSIVIKAVGGCGKPGPGIPTGYRWK